MRKIKYSIYVQYISTAMICTEVNSGDLRVENEFKNDHETCWILTVQPGKVRYYIHNYFL